MSYFTASIVFYFAILCLLIPVPSCAMELQFPPDYDVIPDGDTMMPDGGRVLAFRKDYNFCSAHVWLCTERADGTPVLIMGHNKKHDNLAFFGGLRSGEQETPQETAWREWREETADAVLDVERAQQCMLVTLLQRTWFQRRDSKGLRHVHFIWYVPRSVDLVARLESTGCRLPETADELDSVAVVPFAILTNATERRRWKIRPQCDSALDLYVKEVRPH